jgi:hypothetical protein
VSNQVEKIGTLERVSTGQDENWDLHFGYLIDELFSFFRRKLKGISLGLGAGPAVNTGQIARLGYFPNDDVGTFCKARLDVCGVHIAHLNNRTHKAL